MRLGFAVVIAACLGLAAAAAAAEDSSLTGDDYGNEEKLAAILWSRSPDVLDARTTAGVAASELMRSRLFPNPTLDATWGTIPIGRTNPSDLHDPLANVPNYSAGISELIEIAKRGPRQAAAVAEFERSRLLARATFAARFFDLLDAVGTTAKNQYRASVMSELVDTSQNLLALDRVRASKGDIAGMELDRAEVEHLRLVVSRDSAQSDLEAARASCAAILGVSCPPFESGHIARLFLEKAAAAPAPDAWTTECEERRPDIAALSAALRGARQREILAEHRAIPDVTLRVGYTYDTFAVSGNQEQSLAVGVQVPLPVLDRGEADIAAAQSTLTHAAATRQSLIESGRVALDSAVHQRALLQERRPQVEEALAKARSVRDALEATMRRGGASLTDVLLARRAHRELSLERIDLDAAAYGAMLKIRQAAALYPQPEAAQP